VQTWERAREASCGQAAAPAGCSAAGRAAAGGARRGEAASRRRMLAHPHSKAGGVLNLFAKVLFRLCRALLTLPLAHHGNERPWSLPLPPCRPRQR
jgi:hypothetical protein